MLEYFNTLFFRNTFQQFHPNIAYILINLFEHTQRLNRMNRRIIVSKCLCFFELKRPEEYYFTISPYLNYTILY